MKDYFKVIRELSNDIDIRYATNRKLDYGYSSNTSFAGSNNKTKRVVVKLRNRRLKDLFKFLFRGRLSRGYLDESVLIDKACIVKYLKEEKGYTDEDIKEEQRLRYNYIDKAYNKILMPNY